MLEEFWRTTLLTFLMLLMMKQIDYDELITAWDGGQTEYRRLPVFSDNEEEAESQLSFVVSKSGYSGDETEIQSIAEVSGSPDAIQDLGDNKVIDVAVVDTVNKELDKSHEIYWDADKFDWDRKGLTEVRSWKGVTIKLNDLSFLMDNKVQSYTMKKGSNSSNQGVVEITKMEDNRLHCRLNKTDLKGKGLDRNDFVENEPMTWKLKAGVRLYLRKLQLRLRAAMTANMHTEPGGLDDWVDPPGQSEVLVDVVKSMTSTTPLLCWV